jgi:hypothetical protein
MSLWLRRVGPLRLLALLNLLLAAGLTWLWVDEHAVLRSLAWVAPKSLAPEIKLPAASGLGVGAAADAAQFAVILDRPLFAPDRRQPPPPPPPAPPPPPDPLADMQIVGIFTGDNAGILARVDGKLRRIKVKEAVGPWTLKSIDGRDILFTQGDQDRKLRLAYAKLNAPAAQAPVAANAAMPPPGLQPAAGLPQNAQDEVRERLKRRNELRASRGLPPVFD